MSEGLISVYRRSLPQEILEVLTDHLSNLGSGNYFKLLQSSIARELLGHACGERRRLVGDVALLVGHHPLCLAVGLGGAADKLW